ncbi:zinc finger protein-domain-containing protein [Hypoxylon sp. NC1633]|nr:zinc finger protein-domain-containing protein [Hypoxylon sp. NC1633]
MVEIGPPTRVHSEVTDDSKNDDTTPQLLSVLDSTAETAPARRQLGELERSLSNALSIHGVVSTSSSFAQRQAAAQLENKQSFTKIGAGACGAIFAQDGKSYVLKLAKTTGQELWNDYSMHTLIFEKMRAYKASVHVPEPYFFVTQDNEDFFDTHASLVEAAKDTCNLPTDVLVTERIIPLPRITRALLIKKYCVQHHQQAALTDHANRDCIVRVYLGSLKGESGRRFFSLRNFKLHLNQLAELDMDLGTIASEMAKALAIMHWSAKTDARDVEFALGSSSHKVPVSPKSYAEISKMPRKSSTGPPSGIMEDFFHRTTELWLLDFNQVRSVTFDQGGVEQMIDAFKVNDPYFPRPLQDDELAKTVWNQFAESYLRMAGSILVDHERQIQELPRRFLRGIIEVQRRKAAGNQT